jgi:hypothetical protein
MSSRVADTIVPSFVLKGREFLDTKLGSELAHVRDEIPLPLTGHAKAQHQPEELDHVLDRLLSICG